MKQRHSAEQIVAKLRQADVELGKGLKVPEVCKQLGISDVMVHDEAVLSLMHFGVLPWATTLKRLHPADWGRDWRLTPATREVEAHLRACVGAMDAEVADVYVDVEVVDPSEDGGGNG